MRQLLLFGAREQAGFVDCLLMPSAKLHLRRLANRLFVETIRPMSPQEYCTGSLQVREIDIVAAWQLHKARPKEHENARSHQRARFSTLRRRTPSFGQFLAEVAGTLCAALPVPPSG